VVRRHRPTRSNCECPWLALSGHSSWRPQRPLSGVKRTLIRGAVCPFLIPKQTSRLAKGLHPIVASG
jgi:hypothetical protein